MDVPATGALAPAAQGALVNDSGARDMLSEISPFSKIIPVAPVTPAAHGALVNDSGARDMLSGNDRSEGRLSGTA